MPTIQDLTIQQIRERTAIVDGAKTPFDISVNAGDNTKIDITSGEAVASWENNGEIKTQIISYAGQTGYSPVFGSGLANDYFCLYLDKSNINNVQIVIGNYESYADIPGEVGLSIVFYAVITRDLATNEIIVSTVDYHFPALFSPQSKNRLKTLKEGSEKIDGYIVEAETSNYGAVTGSYLKLNSGVADTAGRGDEIDFSSAYEIVDPAKQGAEPLFESSSLGGRGNIGQIITNRPKGTDAKVFISEKPWYEPEDGTTLKYIGAIDIAGDFPSSPAEDDCYEMNANVTDNDPTKTNTGQSFTAGEIYKWDGVSAWIDTGYRQVPTGKVVVYKAQIFPGSRIIVLTASDRVYDTINDAKYSQHIMDTEDYNNLQRYVPMVDCSYDTSLDSMYLAIQEGFDPDKDWDDVANDGLYEFFGKNIKDITSRHRGETMTTQGLGTGTFYNFGFYESSSTSITLNQATPTQTYGIANTAYGAHAFIVASGAGSASGGSGLVEVEVSGTSITDEGVRVASDTEVIIIDITSLSANQYQETDKKWIGTITYTIQPATGSTQTTYSLTFNYGFAKYEDFGNRDFVLTDFQIHGYAGANDNNWRAELLHHKATGWTYSASGFIPGDGAIIDSNTDLVTEKRISSGKPYAHKRSNLSKFINGGANEGVILRITTTANNAIEYQNTIIDVNEV